MSTGNTKRTTRLHTVNIYDQTYLKIKQILVDKGGTITDLINDTLMGYANRESFLAMYAPTLKQELISDDALYIKDNKLDKIAIVRLKIYPDTDLENSGYYGFCETCDSESCSHVRYSLASGSLLRLQPLGKRVS